MGLEPPDGRSPAPHVGRILRDRIDGAAKLLSRAGRDLEEGLHHAEHVVLGTVAAGNSAELADQLALELLRAAHWDITAYAFALRQAWDNSASRCDCAT